jgi:hypothetical protein
MLISRPRNAVAIPGLYRWAGRIPRAAGAPMEWAAAPRRRNFKTVPMILNHASEWDAVALAYKSEPKQSWDNTDLTGPWLNGMRNSMNAQIWSLQA